MSHSEIFGIDLGTTNSCIAYVDEYGKAFVIPNREGDLTTPSVIQFEGKNRIVGKEAKNNALLYPDQVVERVKQHMGEATWRFSYDGVNYTAEEISSYILKKLADDAELYLGRPVKDVVITCPAYFGIAQREATVKAGTLAGLRVYEVINEPTAAAIMYGLQQERDQLVLVYDLGGGTFDITVVEIKNGAITVIATGGDNNLGGWQWDFAVLSYLDDQWMAKTNLSDSPLSSAETQQDLIMRIEEAKKSLSVRQETKVIVAHAGRRVSVPLTRDIFGKETSHLLKKTIALTRETMRKSQEKGIRHFDQIVLVGGSTRMPQVEERLKAEFNLPIRIFDPDQAVARGAAAYGHKLLISKQVEQRIAQMTGLPTGTINVENVPNGIKDEVIKEVVEDVGLTFLNIKKTVDMKITNVASHSFGVVVTDVKINKQIISNIVFANEPLPVVKTKIYRTAENNQEDVEIQVMENSESGLRVENLAEGEEVGNIILYLPHGLPQYSPIEVTFALQRDGRLQVTGRERISNVSIQADIQTNRGLSEEEFYQARARSADLIIS